MLHHPTVHAAGISEAVEQIARLALLSAVVHGALITLMLLIAYGFIITGLCALVPHLTPVDWQINRQLLMLCRVLNQSCANFAVVAMSVGIMCWSLDLCHEPGARRVVGILGCLVGLVPALALIFGALHLDVPGLTLVVAMQATWNIAVVILMIRREPLAG